MIKNYTKNLRLLMMLILMNGFNATSQITFRPFPMIPHSTVIYDINDSGNGIGHLKLYDYANDSFSNVGSINDQSISNNGDLAGIMPLSVDGVYNSYIAYKRNGIWNPIKLIPNGATASAPKISENGNFVAGTFSTLTSDTAYLYNISADAYEETPTPAAYQANIVLSVSDTGIIGGFAYTYGEIIGMNDETATYIIPGSSVVSALPSNPNSLSNENKIYDINASNIMVGNQGRYPIIFDLNTGTLTTFPLPPGCGFGRFTAMSDTGVVVGVNVMAGNSVSMIYHPTLSARPILLTDLLEENDITVNDNRSLDILDISANGQFICGSGYSIDNRSWIINFNNALFSNCFINSREDENITADASGVVNYMMPTTVCSSQSDATLVLTSGLPSGSVFPVGVTTISYDMVNSSGTVLDSCSFNLTINCTPSQVPTVSAITAVHDDSGAAFQFFSPADSTAGYEDFTSVNYETCYISAGNFNLPYPLHLKGNTNGNNTDYFTVFIDWNNDGTFDNGFERNDMGTVTNSTGTDEAETIGYLNYPLNSGSGLKTRMRVIKNRGSYVNDACSVSSGIGQIEDYTAQFTGGLLSTVNVAEQQFKLYPNPAKNIFNIESQSTIKEIIIYNLLGQEVLKTKANDTQERIDISGLPINTYLIKILSEEGSETLKLIKQ